MSRSRLTIEHIWILTLLAMVWFFLSITPLPPNDLWWHMEAGRLILEEGQLITTNRWAYTLPYDAPYIYQSWLSEIIMYSLWWLGDVPLLSLARTIAICSAYGIVAWHSLRHSNNGKATTFALLIAFFMGWSNWTLRPQTLALPLGALFFVVLNEYLDGRLKAKWLVALPVLIVIWVNSHGSFALGLALIGMAWLGNSISALRGDKEAQGRFRALSAACAASLVAIFCNPLGLGIIPYLRMMLSNSSLQNWFIEWQAPDNELSLTNVGFWFYAVLLLLGVLMAINPRRPRASDLLWYLALSWLTIGGVRYVMWYGLLLMPLLAKQFAQFSRQGVQRPTISLPLINRVLGVIAVVCLVGLLPWFQPAGYFGLQRFFADAGKYPLLIGNTTPVRASEWLAENPIDGRFWTNMNYSSYTVWRLPNKQVFADLRVELFPEQTWRDYFSIVRADRGGLELLDQWEISHLLLDKEGDKTLYQTLEGLPNWCEVFSDDYASIIKRCH